MSKWLNASINTKEFVEPIRDGLTSALQALQLAEKVVELVLDFVKTFLIGLTSPIKAVLLLLLALIRKLIATINATGLSFLAVIPNTSLPTINAQLASVYGGYDAFERTVVNKLTDQTDVNAPKYTKGSSAFMLIGYISVTDFRRIYEFINTLRYLYNTPSSAWLNLPSPVNLTVKSVDQAGALLATFKDLFSGSKSNSLVLQWEMQADSSGSNVPGFFNSTASIINSYRYPYFLIERTQVNVDGIPGKLLTVKVNNAAQGKLNESIYEQYGLQSPPATESIKEKDNSTEYRFFEKRIKYDDTFRGGALGFLSNNYTYIDTDVVAGQSYYYRVSAYSGEIDPYLSIKDTDITKEGSRWYDIQNLSIPVVNYNPNSKGTVVGKHSSVVRGVVPIFSLSEFNPYEDIFDTLLLGAMLNVDLPSVSATSAYGSAQLTGYGKATQIGAVLLPWKRSYGDSKSFCEGPFARAAVRELTNLIVARMYSDAGLYKRLSDYWNKRGVKTLVRKVIRTDKQRDDYTPAPDDDGDELTFLSEKPGYYIPDYRWGFPDISKGEIVNGLSKPGMDSILSFVETDVDTGRTVSLDTTAGEDFITKQCPLSCITAEERQNLSEMMALCTIPVTPQKAWLSWSTISVGSLFPDISFFLRDFEQFVFNLVKALDDIGKKIDEIKQSLVYRIKQLETVVQTIVAIVNLLDISLTASLLFVDTNDGLDGLVSGLSSSEDKPSKLPGYSSNSLYLGFVATAGGPGPESVTSSVNAVKALANLLKAGGG
jgi:hypothetical protein